MDINQLRDLLPVTKDYIYMNTGWAGPSTSRVLDKMSDTLKAESNMGPASAKGVEFTHSVEADAKKKISQMVNSPEEDMLITHSTREGINIVLYGMTWQPDDELLICDLEHMALTTPSKLLETRFGVTIRSVQIPYITESAEIVRLIENAINDKTKLIALSHIQYTCGLRMPIKEIAAVAKKAGIPTLIDGAQTVGQIELDMQDLGCDFYAMPGQKWLMGPVGTGALYVNTKNISEIHPLFSLKKPMDSDTVDTPNPLAGFSLVSQNPGLLAGFSESIDISGEIGIDKIANRTMNLSSLMRDLVSSIGGCNLLSPKSTESACGLVTVSLDNWTPQQLASALQDDFKIVGRTVRGPDGVRFSTHYFNTEFEVEQVAEALIDLVDQGPPNHD